jgi:transposase InsO family protein
VQEEIVETKKRFPWFGLRTLRDFLFRFRGMKVSPGGVGATLDRAGVPRQERSKSRVRRKKEQPRRFERAHPMDLWQSDITSFNLARQSRRVYLTVFLDDCSRYVVAFALNLHQRQDLVIETLLSGIASFGKPKEVLTDQGRQYFAWRGKASFEKLLEREGIKHVVARAHHPQTVGKCERLWDTVYREFWTRVMPEDLADARERLARYFAHYNFFRPHASLEGATPAPSGMLRGSRPRARRGSGAAHPRRRSVARRAIESSWTSGPGARERSFRWAWEKTSAVGGGDL